LRAFHLRPHAAPIARKEKKGCFNIETALFKYFIYQ